MQRVSRRPPSGAPEGTIWFGGPVDRFKVTLRIRGDDLDPDRISALLGCAPTHAERKGFPVSLGDGTRIANRGRWLLTLESTDCEESEDVDGGIRRLLAKLPSDLALWSSLTSAYTVDLFCGLFMAAANRGFGISIETSKLLSNRQIEVGFDLYFEPPDEPSDLKVPRMSHLPP